MAIITTDERRRGHVIRGALTLRQNVFSMRAMSWKGRSMPRFALILGLITALHSVAWTQEPAPPKSQATSEKATNAATFAATEARRYEVRHSEKSTDKSQLVDKPLLRWSNPTDGEVHGSVFLWTSDGCPEAVASIYKFFDREQINVELVSLSEFSLHVRRNNRLRWTPEVGIAFKPVPEAPPAAESVERRQLQMRSLARKYTGLLADRGDDMTFSQLRLMSRPLHVYQSSDATREGAVFALVNTTDPEILVMIESRKIETGRKWMFAAARMHFCRLQLKDGDQVVWEAAQAAPPWESIRGPKGDYVILEWQSEEQAAADKVEE